ncbi:heme utilization cystosolic carrier protein HutX [Mycoplana sp. MJR14]|uniref:heme utilization cystosolic carrier protein HutX n=1 Tax=Mycoplana sp. MJR14 TaxID=3032583 RepID=UPI0023DBA9B9|nr:heme utilization cystosolic carrier protein HutX [Mycoplana sp. MJR14]MDF1632718.1 heme utilization cystosolic carrier protein HutX [Mycoplana sp. MJR14]
MQDISHSETYDRIRQAIAEKPDGILEALAQQFGVSLQCVVECLPGGVTRIDGSRFVEVLGDIAEWGDITFIVHTSDAIVEFSGPMPRGRMGHGMYNLQGGGSGLSGHLRPENCKAIFLVRRPFMGMETMSVQFFNAHGETIFKIYVGRDAEKKLKADQVERFDRLATLFSETAVA